MVKVKAHAGKHNVVMPNGETLEGGKYANLTPTQFRQIPPSLISTYVDNADDGLVVVYEPIDFASIADGTVKTIKPGIAGKIIGFDVTVLTAVSTGSKASTLTLELDGAKMTGGVLSLASATLTPAGAVVAASAITTQQNEKQTITVNSGTTSGTFDVTNIAGTAKTLLLVPFDVTNTALQTLLEAQIGVGNITVTGGPGATAALTLEFKGTLGTQDLPTTTVLDNHLVGTGHAVVAAQTQAGSRTTFASGGEIVIKAASTTTFIEGAGVLRILIQKV